MYFKSKYSGWCWFCQNRINKGDLISWDAEKRKAKHKICPEHPKKSSRRKVQFWS